MRRYGAHEVYSRASDGVCGERFPGRRPFGGMSHTYGTEIRNGCRLARFVVIVPGRL